MSDGDVFINGGTDTTQIGNIGDRLKVTSGAGGVGGLAVFSKKLRYEDMNASRGGIARSTAVGTTFTNLYSYTGSGIFGGFRVNVQTLSDWFFRIVIDSTDDILEGTAGLSMADFTDNAIYGFGDLDPVWGGLQRSGNIFVLQPPTFIKFDSKVEIKAKTAGSKNFLAGIAMIQKDS